MLGRLYHIVVAVVAVSLVLAIVLGALFVVIQGLLLEFLDLDIWTPVAETLAPLIDDLAAMGRALWAWAGDLWAWAEALWEGAMDALNSEEPTPPEGGGED